jgi:hypothetical protein
MSSQTQPVSDQQASRPPANHFAVLWADDDQTYFPTRADAILFVKSLIKKAKDEADVDGYPGWFRDVMVLEIVATVTDSIDGPALFDQNTGSRLTA